MKEEKKYRLIQIIAEISGTSKDMIHLSDRLREDLRLDSVNIVHLQVEIEDTFDIRFDPGTMDLASIFMTVSSLVDFIENIEEN